MRYSVRLLPYSGFYAEETARWLEEQAANGRHLHRILGNTPLALFETAPPQAVRFFAEYAKRGDPAAVVREDGSVATWEFVGSAGGTNLYRCDDPSVPLPTISKEAELSALRKAFSGNLLFLLLLSLLIGLRIHRFIDTGLWINLASLDGVFDLCLIAGLVFTALLALSHILAAKRAVRRLSSQAPCANPSKHVGWIQVALSALAAIALIASAVSLCGTPSVPREEYSKPLPIPTAEVLIGECRSSNGTSSVSHTSTPIAPTALTYHQDGQYTSSDGALVDYRLDITYYRTRSPWFAQQLVRDLIGHEYISCYTTPHEIHIDGIEYAVVYDGINVFLQNNATVIVADFNTWDRTNEIFDPIPAQTWIPLVADYLK